MAFSSANIALSAPLLSFEGRIDQISSENTVGLVTLDSEIRTGWDFAAEVPSLSFASPLNFGWDLAATLPTPSFASSNYTGLFLSFEQKAPKPLLQVNLLKKWVLSKEIKAPVFSATGYTNVEWGETSLTAPLPELSASIITEVLAIYESWCMNIRNSGTSEFLNFAPTSVARVGNKYYGTFSDGIYELSGDLDNGDEINATAELGIDTFEGAYRDDQDVAYRKKQSHGAYVNLRSDGRFAVTVKIDEDNERIYEIAKHPNKDGLHQRRVQIARGLEGINWQFGFKNIDGSDFFLKGFRNLPVVLKRRV